MSCKWFLPDIFSSSNYQVILKFYMYSDFVNIYRGLWLNLRVTAALKISVASNPKLTLNLIRCRLIFWDIMSP